MIARVQSLYLLLAALLALGSMFFPFWSFSSYPVILIADFIVHPEAGILHIWGSYSAGIFSPLTALISIAAIFFYKNRAVQAKLIVLALLLFVGDLLSGLTAAHFMNQYFQSLGTGIQHKPEAGIFMLLPEPILFFLALGGVKKDDKIANAYKRL
ncbi:DUF4293 domain-containing protein [Chlorobium phaeobacteroides]|nr:DUF4293 domain-containing protein [Chlorobium phaeobacteroides]MBV5326077.1 DUF4293 domain-containing protein [Chlorobium sp.]